MVFRVEDESIKFIKGQCFQFCVKDPCGEVARGEVLLSSNDGSHIFVAMQLVGNVPSKL